MPSVEEHLTDE